MKKVNKCETDNCIPTLTSCSEWNGGEIEYLGICDGDSLNTLLWEVITKLQEIAGNDLSQFDIDSLADVCSINAPAEITILSILNLVKSNQICLKDFIDGINERLNELAGSSNVEVNLKCYAEFDNLGNNLSITRETLDQLVIDNLCNQKDRIDTLDGKVISLQSQIDNINNTSTVDELSFATCVDAAIKPTSSQVISIANSHCDLETATGDSADISSALSQTPATDNARYGLLAGWIVVPENWADNYNNLLIKLGNLEERLIFMEDNCCASTCKDVELGFSAVFNEDMSGVIIRFTAGAGTSIPFGFADQGSNGTITDVDGNTVSFNLSIANDSEEEILVSGLNTLSALTVDITAILGTTSLTCQKCLSRKVTSPSCAYCTYTATGDEGSVAVIIYETSVTT